MAQHGFFHQRIARTNGYAMAARDAARLSNGGSPVPKHAGIWIFPVDRERFIDFDVLTCLHAPATEDALIGIVAVERIRVIDLVRLRSKRDSLVLNGQQLRRVMDGAIAIVVIADRAIKKVITEDAIKGFHLGGRGLCRFCGDCHSIGNSDRAGTDKAAVRFHHACVTRLNRAELRVVADLGDRAASTVEQINQELVGLGLLNDAINLNIDHSFSSIQLVPSPFLVAFALRDQPLTGPSR
jgi:hypothetical protein